MRKIHVSEIMGRDREREIRGRGMRGERECVCACVFGRDSEGRVCCVYVCGREKGQCV